MLRDEHAARTPSSAGFLRVDSVSDGLSHAHTTSPVNAFVGSQPGALRTRLTFVALASIPAIFLILWIPSFVPQQPSGSLSYLFGFNNRAAILLLLSFSLAGAWWCRDIVLPPRSQSDRKISWAAVLITALTSICLCAVMYLLIGRRVEAFWESSYEIERVRLLAFGKIPYVDFEWPFGLLMLYGPLWASRLLHWDAREAAYLLWAINTVIGFLLLGLTISLVDYRTERRTRIFLIFAIPGIVLIPMMATHYTLLRYVSPLLFALLVWRRQCRATSPLQQLANTLLSLFFIAVLLAISPETAIALTWVCMVLFWPLRKAMPPLPRARVLPFVVLVFGGALLYLSAWHERLLVTLLSSGSGAESLPMFLAPSIVFFFAVVAVGVAILVRQFVGTTELDGTSVLILYSIPTLAAALGRCDPVHMVCNGMGFLIAVAFSASSRKLAWRIFSVSYLFCLAAVAVIGTFLVGWPAVDRVFHESMRQDAQTHRAGFFLRTVASAADYTASRPWTRGLHRHLAEAQQDAQNGPVTTPIDVGRLFPLPPQDKSDGILQTPFRFYPVPGAAHVSVLLDSGYYGSFENATSKAAIDRKIEELIAHPHRGLVVLADYDKSCADNPIEGRRVLEKLFLVPFRGKTAHLGKVRQPLCDYIDTHYRVTQPATESSYGYEVLEPR